MKHKGRLRTVRMGNNGMELAWINEIKAFFLNLKLFHIDKKSIAALRKVEDFHFIMPVMGHAGPVFFLTDLV